ncbi:CocE/NonD family hydrolase [Amycolatopsis anabasis]|uniref:CocE/NonD family hydrolase n=1 Tax=Amycolatopsis anabasis TaxID=1840409 RepID=UPI00131E78F7|nr:CocE/NonD family hydrolase [Amycolatopsis anabasis]
MDRSMIRWSVPIPMRDGIRLRGDLWLPGSAEPAPVIIYRTPYGRAGMDGYEALRPVDAARAGYAVLVQDTRGCFESEGEARPAMWDQEGRDTYDTVEWAAGQPWCDGNAGMAGASYPGMVQWAGAGLRPPHLRAIAPMMATDGPLDRAETGGAIRLDHYLGWAALMALSWMRREERHGREIDPESLARAAALLDDTSPRTALFDLRAALRIDGSPYDLTRHVLVDSLDTPVFPLPDISIPTLLVAGFFDVFSAATIRLHQRMTELHGEGDRHRLIIGPWAHAGGLPNTQGTLNFGVTSSGVASGLPAKHLAFFDHYLRGRPGERETRVEYFLMGARRWRTATSWPPPGTTRRRLYLHGRGDARDEVSGRLAENPAPAGDPPENYGYDPHDPAPSHGGRLLATGDLVGGPLDQHHLLRRADVLAYTTAPLGGALDVIGPVELRLRVASSAPDTDFAAKLVDVTPDGRWILVCDGLLRARYRAGFEREIPLRPGEPTALTVDLGHTAWRFRAGHRLGVLITSSSFPHLDRNTNTGNAIGTDDRAEIARQTVFHAGDLQSYLRFSVDGQAPSTV